MLTPRQHGSLTYIQGEVYLNAKDINPQVVFEMYTFENTATSPVRQCAIYISSMNIIFLIETAAN